MAKRTLNTDLSINALTGQLRRIAARGKIAKTCTDLELAKLRDLANFIFSTFDFEKRMRQARRVNAERDARRSENAKIKALKPRAASTDPEGSL